MRNRLAVVRKTQDAIPPCRLNQRPAIMSPDDVYMETAAAPTVYIEKGAYHELEDDFPSDVVSGERLKRLQFSRVILVDPISGIGELHVLKV